MPHFAGIGPELQSISPRPYHAAGLEYATPVDYVGQLSDDGTRVVGMWSLLQWDGSFEMFRDIAVPPEIEVEVSEEVPIGSELRG